MIIAYEVNHKDPLWEYKNDEWLKYHKRYLFSFAFFVFRLFLNFVQTMSAPWTNVNTIGWRHKMETFSALLALCVGNSPVTGEFPSQRPVTWGVDVVCDLRLNTRLSKQSWGWWFETSSRSLWRHGKVTYASIIGERLCGDLIQYWFQEN